jgi:hypothetical protein
MDKQLRGSMSKASSKYILRFLAAIGIMTVAYCVYTVVLGSQTPAVEAQSDRYLESRLSQMEQRFYQIESRLNRIEQDSITRRSTTSSPVSDNRAQEITLLQNELIGFRVRLGEVECGLLKLDERTLPASRRLGGRNTTGSDRCRQDWASPVQLSARP